MHGIPKYFRDAGLGAPFMWVPRRRDTGSASLLAADVDFFLTSFTPVVDDDWQDMSLSILNNGRPDVARNVTLSKTDANNSLMLVLEIIGEDQFGNSQKEILRLKAADSTVAGQVAWDSVSSLRYKATGDATGDTATVGIGQVIGVPREIYLESDVVVAVSDTAGAGAGPADEVTAETLTVEPEWSTVDFNDPPDGTNAYYIEIRSTWGDGGVPPLRPRATNSTVQSS